VKNLLIIILVFTVLNNQIFHLGIRERLFGKSVIELESPSANGLYDVYETKQANIVMLGDSLIAFPSWNELLGREDVVNRGIFGDTTKGVLNRLEYVCRLKPIVCFLMVGVNDLTGPDTPEEISRNIAAITSRLSDSNIRVIVCLVLLTDNYWMNIKIAEINKHLRVLNNVEILDMNTIFASGGILGKEFTYDGTHLTGRAYSLFSDRVLELLHD